MADAARGQAPRFIFAYGLLTRGGALHGLLSAATFAGEATVAGTLVSLDDYPGLLAGEGEVAGELYSADDLPALLDALDDAEDYDPTDPERSLYIREACAARRADGTIVAAWAYRYAGALSHARPIPSGRWRRV